MAQETLLLTANDLARLTTISGGVDIDKLTPFIYTAQKNEIRRILGINLYNKILADYEADTLVGEYKIIYEEFVTDMLIYYAASDFIKMGTYSITNAGVFKHNPENADVVDIEEIKSLSASYKGLGNAVELVFVDYMKGVSVTEYKKDCSTGNSFGFNWFLD